MTDTSAIEKPLNLNRHGRREEKAIERYAFKKAARLTILRDKKIEKKKRMKRIKKEKADKLKLKKSNAR